MQKNNPFFIFLVFLSVCILPSSFALAAPAVKKNVPTDIKADHLEYSADQQKVVFSGNVHVVREDFELFAAKVTVLLKKSKPQNTSDTEKSETNELAPGEVHEIIAEKNVIMKSKQKEARAQKARYLVPLDRITLEGGPPRPWLKDHEKDRTIEGNILHYYVQEERSEGASIHMVFPVQDNAPPKR